MTTRHYILKIKKTHLYETYATCDVAVMGDLTRRRDPRHGDLSA